MPRINSFVICSSVTPIDESNGKKQIQLNSPLAIVSPPCEGTYSFFISVGLIGLDYYSKHTMRCSITSPDKKVIFKTENSPTPVIDKKSIKYHLPEEYRGFFINIDVRNVIFKKAGNYTFDIYIDDVQLNSQLIPVWLPSEEDAE